MPPPFLCQADSQLLFIEQHPASIMLPITSATAPNIERIVLFPSEMGHSFCRSSQVSSTQVRCAHHPSTTKRANTPEVEVRMDQVFSFA
jgi:hypothetical protein